MKDRDLFIAALERTNPAERRAYLDEACGGDEPLRREVEALLAMHERSGSFLDLPPATHPAQLRDTPQEPRIGGEGPGTVIGPYKLLEQIGEGGMGAVYMAEQQGPVRRKVALKVIKPGMDTRQIIARFEAERQALALMDHPHIAKVFDAGTTDAGRPYFVMELVKGVPLTRYCDEHQLTPRQRLELFVPVCLAIQHAHQKGVIHRDLKPSNILVASYDGTPVPKVIDFGVAKATGQQLTERTLFTGFGSLVGTLEYMSPEQAEFNALDVDTRSDIYSLGVLVYVLLTGSTPLTQQRLREASLVEALRLIREEEPAKPSTRLSTSDALASISTQRKMEPAKLARIVQGDLDWIVMKALEKDRARRYETASGLARDLQRYLNNEPVEAGPPSRWYKLRTWARRNGGWGPLLVATFILVSWPVLLLWAVLATTVQTSVPSRVELPGVNLRLSIALMHMDQEARTRQEVLEFARRDLLGLDGGAQPPEADRSHDLDLHLRTLLDRAARQLASKTVPNEEAELRMRALLATAYEEVGEAAKAKVQREKMLALTRSLVEPAQKKLERLREVLGQRHPVTLRASLTLSDLYRRLQNYQEGELLLLACYQQLEAPVSRHLPVDGDLHELLEVWDYQEQLVETLEGLVRLYDAWDKKAKAAQWRKQLQQTKASVLPPLKP
jgi:serine/threonine protein kinase